MGYPVLPSGSLVKPQVRGLNFHWLRVVNDPGPADNPCRIIELARTEPNRADQRIQLRRDRVHTDASRMSMFDVKPSAAVAPPQNATPGQSAATDSFPGIPDFLLRKA